MPMHYSDAINSKQWSNATPDRPCPSCSSTNRCRIAPDGTAAVCWRNGGKVVQCGGGNGINASKDAFPRNGGNRISTSIDGLPRNGKPRTTYATAEDAIRAAGKTIQGGTLTATWSYPDRSGNEVMRVARFDTPDGEKQFRPVHLKKGAWRIGDPPKPLPLYRLPEIKTSIDVLIVAEGEKCADAVAGLGLTCTTSAHGAVAADQTDWTPAKGKGVVIIPDHDEPGGQYARDVARLAFEAGAAGVRILELPGLGEGEDVADWIERGGTRDELVKLGDAVPWMDRSEVIEDYPVPLGRLWEQFPTLAEPVIDGLLRRGQVGNVVSTSKSYKTYLLLGLAIDMAMKRHWLDRFPCAGGRVLLIDLELQRPDIVHRTQEIARATFAPMDRIGERIEVVSLRGKVSSIDHIERRLLSYEPGQFALVIIDPLYKTYPDGFDENNNAHMTRLYQRYERIAEHLQAALLICHHGTKGSQAEKRTVDVGSGASAQSRSADFHGALREHEEEGAVVFDARVRSFPPPAPLVLEWQYPTWRPATHLDPAALKRPGGKARAAKETEPEEPKEEPWTPERFASTFIADEPRTEATILTAAEVVKLPERRAKRLLSASIDAGLVHRWTYGNQKIPHRFATTPQPVTATQPEAA